MNIDGGSPVDTGTGMLDGLAPDDTTDLLWLRGDGGATDHVRVRSTYDGRLIATRAGTVIAATVPGVIRRDVWQYVEVLAVLDDFAGTVTVRVDNVEVATISGVDTRNVGTSPVFDTLRLTAAGFGYDTLYDDLYIRSGSTAIFLGDHPITGVLGLIFRPPTHAWRTVRLAVSDLPVHGPRYERAQRSTAVQRGVNVWLLADGTFTEHQPVRNRGVVKMYPGGHENVITPTERDQLVSAGYGDFIGE